VTHHVRVHLLLPAIDMSVRQFAHLYVDLVGSLPLSLGYTQCLPLVDSMAKAAPLSSTTTANCAQVLNGTWILHFEVPETFTSDYYAQFTTALG
jgi:hypothetical protein